MPPPAAKSQIEPRRSKISRFALVSVCAALLLIGVGFAGLDRWFYEHVSCVLNIDEGHPSKLTFYGLTKPFWDLCRLFIGHALAGLVILGYAVAVEPRRWRVVTAAALAIALAGLLANVIQAGVGRARPNRDTSPLTFTPFKQFVAKEGLVAQIFGKEGVCFPSGEAATAFALAAVLSAMYPRWRVVLYAAGTLGAVTRLMNGAHYLSDVAAGALLGGVVGLWFFRLLAKLLRADGHTPSIAALPPE
jgi:membrane-associated phospholipid phosphatase